MKNTFKVKKHKHSQFSNSYGLYVGNKMIACVSSNEREDIGEKLFKQFVSKLSKAKIDAAI